LGRELIRVSQIAFMGDDTWMTVFPDTFRPEMTHPYDSFNVEDLHTVDEGVITHLFPLLEQENKSWDFLIGHFLGVDHVGHRVGPDHPTMRVKLAQMDNVLRRVVDRLEDDTLLIVLGDHGMDRRGDHGGDGELETAAAMWFYSKMPLAAPLPASLAASHGNTTFPSATASHRAIQQIDLVPTLSLLLGLPIPFNNLGSIIPELFLARDSGAEYSRALELNAAQVKRYLDAYRGSASGGELDAVWSGLQATWEATTDRKALGHVEALHSYTREALAACRSLWAQFDVTLMALGLALITAGVLACWVVFSGLGTGRGAEDWEGWVDELMPLVIRGCAGGAVVGILSFIGLEKLLGAANALDLVIFGCFMLSSLTVLVARPPSITLNSLRSFPLPLVIHALAFLSNSFTFWEDRMLQYLLLTALVPFVLIGFTAPTPTLRKRILGFSALFATCVRLMAISTVCREEQQPYCHVTFFASSSLPSPPPVVLALSLPVAIFFPSVILRYLAISKSDRGVAPLFFPWLLRPTLVAASAGWILEWMESAEVLGAAYSPLLRTSRTILARCAIGGVLIGGCTLWWMIPACLEIVVENSAGDALQEPKKQVTVLGFANAFGSPYFVFWCIFLGLLCLATQLTGQVVLALAAVALLSYLELLDSTRDVEQMNIAFNSNTPSAILNIGSSSSAAPIAFSEIVPLALLGLHTFYATGHQSTISSIQWKTAFVVTPTLTYPFSPALVILNTFGPQLLFALATPLVALWNVSPLPHPAASMKAAAGSLRAAVGVVAYFCVLLLGTALSSAWLRRHLMVWKVFAPRFMAAAAGMVAVDVAAVLAVAFGSARVIDRVGRIFARVGSASGTAEKQSS
jgi:GPI ethanolamine phosphate transferase 3 subunit O